MSQVVVGTVRGLVVGLSLLAAGFAARAADFHFNLPAGAFNLGPSWLELSPPGAGDKAIIDNGGTAVLATSTDVGRLYIASAGGTSGSMTMTGGTLNVLLEDMRVGEFGTGSFSMSGGVINHGPLTSTSADMNIGRSGNGAMTMTGGTMNLGGSVRVARGGDAVGTGTLTMSG